MPIREIAVGAMMRESSVRSVISKLNKRVRDASRFRMQRDELALDFGLPWDRVLWLYNKNKGGSNAQPGGTS